MRSSLAAASTIAAVVVLSPVAAADAPRGLSSAAAKASIASCQEHKTPAPNCLISAASFSRQWCQIALERHLDTIQIDVAVAAQEAADRARSARVDWTQCTVAGNTYLRPHLEWALRALAKKPAAVEAAKALYIAAKSSTEQLGPKETEDSSSFRARIADQDRRMEEAISRLEIEF